MKKKSDMMDDQFLLMIKIFKQDPKYTALIILVLIIFRIDLLYLNTNPTDETVFLINGY